MAINKIIPYIKKVDALQGNKLVLEFEDGVKGIIDLSKWKGRCITYWDDDNNFKSFQITNDRKIKWNEDIDMDPDAFYLQLVNKSFLEYAGD